MEQLIEITGTVIYRNMYKYVHTLYITAERRGIFEWDQAQQSFIQLVSVDDFIDKTCDLRNIKQIIRGNIKLRIMQDFGLTKCNKVYFKTSWQIENKVAVPNNPIRSYYDNGPKPAYTISAW